MAFLVALIIALFSLGLGVLGALATMMSPTGRERSGVAPFVIAGLLLAALVAGTHWLTHIGW